MRFVAGLGAVAESHRESAASRGAVVAKLLRPGDATERDAAGRGTVVDLLARAPRRCCWQGAPWWICWPGRQGGAAGRGYRGEEDGGTVAGVAASGSTCRNGSVHKKNLPGYRGAKPWQVCDDYSALKNALIFFLFENME